MKLERTGARYRVNGLNISLDTLSAICREFYGENGWKKIQGILGSDGFLNIDNAPRQIVKNAFDELNIANKKIAALEKRVTELTIQNIYLTA